jgi:hypothetical protein
MRRPPGHCKIASRVGDILSIGVLSNAEKGTGAMWELFVSIVGGAIGAYYGSYFRRSGEIAAIKAGLDTLREQARVMAEATRSVEQRFARADLVARSEFDFIRQQLTELYGPLYASLATTRELYNLWMGHQMPEVNFLFKKMLAKNNEVARSLISQKAHLIEGGRMPEAFVRFVTSTTIWDLYAAATPEGEVPEALKRDERSKFPAEFVTHVYAVTEELKARLKKLHAEHPISLPSL